MLQQARGDVNTQTGFAPACQCALAVKTLVNSTASIAPACGKGVPHKQLQFYRAFVAACRETSPSTDSSPSSARPSTVPIGYGLASLINQRLVLRQMVKCLGIKHLDDLLGLPGEEQGYLSPELNRCLINPQLNGRDCLSALFQRLNRREDYGLGNFILVRPQTQTYLTEFWLLPQETSSPYPSICECWANAQVSSQTDQAVNQRSISVTRCPH